MLYEIATIMLMICRLVGLPDMPTWRPLITSPSLQVIAFASDVSLLTLVFPVAMLLYALPSQSPHPRFWHVRPTDVFSTQTIGKHKVYSSVGW